jgi:hypothetical protein
MNVFIFYYNQQLIKIHPILKQFFTYILYNYDSINDNKKQNSNYYTQKTYKLLQLKQ